MRDLHKKIAALIILLTLAGIVWRERLSGSGTAAIPAASQENPFTDVQEVPLKLDSLEIPSIDSPGAQQDDAQKPWGRDPFDLRSQPEQQSTEQNP